jgi:hypothetical protein
MAPKPADIRIAPRDPSSLYWPRWFAAVSVQVVRLNMKVEHIITML